MKKIMTPKERALTAFAHQEPDRVPTAMWGGPYGMVDEIYFSLLERFGLGEPVPQLKLMSPSERVNAASPDNSILL